MRRCLGHRNLQSNVAKNKPVVAVVGTGSVGRRHVANLLALGAHPIACSRTAGREFLLSDGTKILASNDCDGAIRIADAVVVATPTDEHMALAFQVLAAGKPLFIEKPISHSVEGLAELRRASQNVIVEVGCQLRAHPALRALKNMLATQADGPVLAFRGCVGQRLDQWRPGSDYRTSYSADRERGGGALFDLVHEIDLSIWLCGAVKGVFAKLSQVSDLELKADDLANLILETSGGACGNLQLDMVSPSYRRTFEVVCQHASYDWNYVEGLLRRNTEKDSEVFYQLPEGFDRNILFLSHMRHFLARISGAVRDPMCSLEDGIANLLVLVAARESARTGMWTTVGAELH
jgi:predicted dehydrogenase